MNLAKGDMFSVPGYHFVTTNSYINQEGKLVMGRGAAKQFKERYGWDDVFGTIIRDRCGHLGEYNVIDWQGHGIVQVKFHFKQKADLALIQRSLLAFAAEAHHRRFELLHLNFPGIGYGGLDREDVLPLVEDILPDNVLVWELP